MSTARLVRAAGGVVVRSAPGGPELLVVHRPKYDDWSFPKGKLDPGETEEQCALREVAEETGLECVLLRELSPTHYHDRFGRPKRVRYWLMEVNEGFFEANEEVDRVQWLPPEGARRVLSYRHDRALVDEVAEIV